MDAINARNNRGFDITDVIEFLESTGELTRSEPSLPNGHVPNVGDVSIPGSCDPSIRDPLGRNLLESPLPRPIEQFINDGGWRDFMGNDGVDEKVESFDIAAVYWPIHFYADKWGIGIRTDAASRLALRIGKEHGGWSQASGPSAEQWEGYFDAATMIYRLHETWHHRVEAAAIRLYGDPVLGSKPTYRHYSANVYDVTWGTDDCLEEALANAHVLRELRTDCAKKMLGDLALATLRVARRMVEVSPPGYRRGVDFTSDKAWNNGRSELLDSLVSGTLGSAGPNLGVGLSSSVHGALTRDLHPATSADNVRNTIRWIERGLWI